MDPPTSHSLENSEDRTWLIAGHERDLIAQIDQAGRYVYASPSHLQVLGYDPAQLHGSVLFERVHPLDLAALLEQWSQRESVGTIQTTVRLRHADGSWHWFDTTITMAMRQGNAFLIGIAGDSATSKHSGRVLARLLRHDELILDAIGDGVYEVDLRGNAAFVNQAAARMLGWDAGELIGRPIHALVQHTGTDQHSYSYQASAVYATARDGGVRRVADAIFWRKDATSFPVEYVSAPIREGGTIVGVVVTFQDTTARKRLEAQMSQARKLEGVGRLAGGIAHDFNNLLTGIIGYTGLAMRSLPRDSELYRDMVEIEKASQRAATLIRQLLAFARKQIMTPRALNINDLILNMDQQLRRLLGTAIDLVLLPAADLNHIKADSGQIEQVIMHLADNARDAMPNGGTCIIQTANVVLNDHDLVDHLSEIVPGRYVLIEMSDTGVGMPPEIAAQVFEPFFTTKDPGKGTGLGLATCHGIIKQHNGAIQVASVAGQGTTFKVYLPYAELAQAGDQPYLAELAAAFPRGDETVLVAEDDPTVRELIAFVLREQGYTVLETTNGADALALAEAYAAGTIDLLLTDVVMPQVSGAELAAQLKPMHPSVKILFTSGYTDDPAVVRDRPATGVAFLQKPFSAVELARSVRTLLDS